MTKDVHSGAVTKVRTIRGEIELFTPKINIESLSLCVSGGWTYWVYLG